MIVKLLTEHHLELLSLKGGCRGSSMSTHIKKPHCWKSQATAQIYYYVKIAIVSVSTELTTDNTALLVRVISLHPVRPLQQVSGGNVAVVDGESHLLRTCKPCLMFIPLAVCVHVIFVFQTNIIVKSF